MRLEGRTIGTYEVGEELGRGGMGTVHRATATQPGPAGEAGAVVAIKFFHPHLLADETAIRRFRQEAEIGMDIRHPNVVRTYGIGQEEIDGGSVHYMVMEFVEGQTLRSLLEELGTLPEHLLLHVSDQVLGGLQPLHDLGIVHRDVRPENVVITREHRVLLMDLGVARHEEPSTKFTRLGEFVGSVHYAAPEQFADPDGVGPRSDLYAVGAMLYEMATGQRAFSGTDLTAIIHLRLSGEFRRPRAVDPDLAAFVEEVIVTCMEREPSARFSSCDELRSVLREGEASAWWRQRRLRRAAPTAERALKRLRVPREAPLIGRGQELDRLHDAYTEVRAGHGRTLFLRGAAGSGKSRLVGAFLEDIAASEGPVIVAGRCAGLGGRAYQPFVEAMHDLLGTGEMEVGGRRAEVEERLTELLPDTPGVVRPLADFVLGGLQAGAGDGFQRDALTAGITNALRRAAATRPLVVVIEDLHLAGPETVELLGYLARVIADHPVLLVGLYRDEDVTPESGLAALVTEAGSAVLGLELLPRTATEELLRTVVGSERTVRRLGRLIHEKSEGNPLIILELLAHLRTTGALRTAAGGYELAAPVEEVKLPSTVIDFVTLKLDRLAEDERETLEVASILGYEFRASLLATILEEKRIKLLKRLAVLERKYRFIRSADKDAFRFVTRRFFETIYRGINPGLREEYHALAADAVLESHAGEGPLPGELAYALVHHLLHSERGGEASPHARAAADHVVGHYHATVAAPFLERLRTALDIAKPEVRLAVDLRLWSVYEFLGRGDAQRSVLEEAAGFAEELAEPRGLAQVHACLGVTLWRSGEHERAREESEHALALGREARDREWEANALHTMNEAYNVFIQKKNLIKCAYF